MRIEIDQLWECPTCGAQVGMGSPGKLHPPRCSHGEMEQKKVQAWRQPHEWEDDSDGDE